MTVGWTEHSSAKVDGAVFGRMLSAFCSRGHTEVDTARAYAGGETEVIVGTEVKAVPALAVQLQTKVNPWASAGLA
eukprot:CAMPEP_0183796088 /NCGR_PEP_ID=MMETSP0803_2-20130417/8047_1 /TAXON_ID=195967 /ORGANISM="Crustomastix stigmata, Strain CCMP3273" /LENGTH=75 /DNA_ID=CAMNT_0026040693 /DNA_START=18 /DNA_END=241 /DNA_ORIENTATION=+